MHENAIDQSQNLTPGTRPPQQSTVLLCGDGHQNSPIQCHPCRTRTDSRFLPQVDLMAESSHGRHGSCKSGFARALAGSSYRLSKRGSSQLAEHLITMCPLHTWQDGPRPISATQPVNKCNYLITVIYRYLLLLYSITVLLHRYVNILST